MLGGGGGGGGINVFITVHYRFEDRVSEFSLFERGSVYDFFFS